MNTLQQQQAVQGFKLATETDTLNEWIDNNPESMEFVRTLLINSTPRTYQVIETEEIPF